MGMGAIEYKSLIEELAKEFNAQIGGTKAVVDMGKIGHEYQIGQTGKTIRSKLYIACGISGASQHLAGIRADTVVAINNDPNAPIHDFATWSIKNDLKLIIPEIVKILKSEGSIFMTQ
jgi:electron transfer flavoprotein alpha subunit